MNLQTLGTIFGILIPILFVLTAIFQPKFNRVRASRGRYARRIPVKEGDILLYYIYTEPRNIRPTKKNKVGLIF